MTEKQRKTRPPTTAELHAARAHGQPDPEEVQVDATPVAVLHAARVTALRKSAKPAGMQTAEWFARRTRGEDGPDAA